MSSRNFKVDLQTRYNLYSLQSSDSVDINKAFIQMPFKSTIEANPEFIDSFLLLEWLAAQRPAVKQIKFVSPLSGRWLGHIKSSNFSKGKGQVLQVLFHVTIRRLALNALINFLIVSFYSLADKYLNIDTTVSLNSCFFSISSIDFLAVRPEYLNISNINKIYFYFYVQALINLLKFMSNFNKFFFIRDVWQLLFSELNLTKINWGRIYDKF